MQQDLAWFNLHKKHMHGSNTFYTLIQVNMHKTKSLAYLITKQLMCESDFDNLIFPFLVFCSSQLS